MKNQGNRYKWLLDCFSRVRAHNRENEAFAYTLLRRKPGGMDERDWLVGQVARADVRYTTRVESVLNSGDHVVSAGSGLGIWEIILAKRASSVTVECIDIAEEAVTCCKRMADDLGLTNVTARVGDFHDLDPVRPANVICFVDSLSHVRNTGEALRRVFALLEPQGRTFVFDGNNLLNPGVRRRIQRVYEQSEYRGEPGSYRKIDRMGFREGRKQIIRDSSDLPDAECEMLAGATRGLWKPEIVAYVNRYLETGLKPQVELEFPFVNPFSGEYPERFFNPYSLCRQIELTGFSMASIMPETTPCVNVRDLAWVVLCKLFPRLWMRLRRSFAITAVKGVAASSST